MSSIGWPGCLRRTQIPSTEPTGIRQHRHPCARCPIRHPGMSDHRCTALPGGAVSAGVGIFISGSIRVVSSWRLAGFPAASPRANPPSPAAQAPAPFAKGGYQGCFLNPVDKRESALPPRSKKGDRGGFALAAIKRSRRLAEIKGKRTRANESSCRRPGPELPR